MINFTTLGAFDLRRPQGPVVTSVLSQPKRLAVLLRLALTAPRGFERRDTLLALFWPDSDAAHARNSLSQTLSMLRKELGDGVLFARGHEEVALNHERVWCDAVAFDRAVRAGRLAEALDLYQGSLAPGFHPSTAPSFDQWLEAERQRLREAALTAARKLGRRAREAGHGEEAVTWALRARVIAPLSERSVRDLVHALAVVGDRVAALQVFEAYVDRLAAEYEMEPSPELVERVRLLVDDARGGPAVDRQGPQLERTERGSGAI